MIYIKQNNINKWRVNEYTFSDPQMGIRTINLTVNHPIDWVDGTPIEVPDFKDAYVEHDGEEFYITNSKPTAEKDTSSLSYKYTLAFEAGESDFKRRKIRNLAEAGVDNFISQGTSFSLYADLSQCTQLLNNNLKYYFGSKWSIVLSAPASDSVMLNINNMFIWDLLIKIYEYYGVRWFIRGTTLYIGQDPEIIDHVFDYGVDGGLVKITRTAQSEQTVNRLIGTGGSRNVPMNYFTDRYSNFPADPDPISGDVNIKNIMPKVFRDSVKAGTLPYIDYVEDSDLVSSDGVKEDALEPNEDIFPSIAGVEVPGLGRIDQIIAVEAVAVDDPDQEGYKQTFDVWVKDIQFDLSDDQYTSTEEGKISFTSGYLTGYEFVILAENGQRKVVVDTSKSHNGVSSKYKITLIKSSEEYEASGKMLPNSVLNAAPADSFVIYDINMPQSYVELAEERVQAWLESKLDELKQEKPTYTIEPLDQFFEYDTPESDGKTIREKLKSGNKLKINNSKITDGVQELHINQVTIQYGGILPKYTFVVTDKVNVGGNAVQRLKSSIDAIVSRQVFTERELDSILNGFSTRYLSKTRPDKTDFLIRFLRGLEIGNPAPGLLGSGGTFRMNDGVSELEVDKLLVRMRAEFFSVLIHNAKHIGGELIISAADMICIKVEEFSSFYRCYFDRGENNEVNNLFTNQDRARCQVFTGSGQKFYWRKVIAVGSDYIELSKTDASPGTNDIPAAGDHIFQLGSDDPDRQSAIILSSVGIDAPSWKQYEGINGYSLVDKETTVFSSKGNRIQGKTVFTSGGQNLDEFADGVVGDIQDTQQAASQADQKAQQALDEAANIVVDFNAEIATLQQQIDGEVSNWFYPYSPTLSNYPASEWTTNAIKDRHIGDTFTNTQPSPATDAGKSWRFVKNGSTYSWTQIADSDAVKALQQAAQAQATADGKSTTFLVQPSNYHVGDTWVLNADRTVNGTAYKQGEILTATQDSTTFVEAHWIKRVRYTDDTAVDNLQIGGVNLIAKKYIREWNNVNSDITLPGTDADGDYLGINNGILYSDVGGSTAYNDIFQGKIKYKENTQYALKVKWKLAGSMPYNGLMLRFKYTDGTYSSYINLGGAHTTIREQSIISGSGKSVAGIASAYGDSTYRSRIYDIQLTEGNKQTAGYLTAPEDVQAGIDAAKQEALTAASNAQSSANAAQTSANNLGTYVDGAFKDGVIDAAEAKAIEKSINLLNETMSKAEASYNKVYANTYLEGTAKTNLLNAKINLWGQRDTLLSAINTAISGGSTTPAQKTAYDNAFNTFNTLMSAFQNALEDASKAIQTKLDQLSTQRVDSLQTGGRNLLKNTNRRIEHSNYLMGSFYLGDVKPQTGERVTIAFKGELSPNKTFWQLFVNGTVDQASNLTASDKGADGVWRKTFTWNAGSSGNTYLNIYSASGAQSGISWIEDVMLVFGNKIAYYSKAPEDVQEGIDSARLTAEQAQLAADGYMRARYVRDYITGSTSGLNNNWCEIKIINKAGVNLAAGKIPTANGIFHASNPASNITDGNINNQGYIQNSVQAENYVQIDLGAIHSDIDYIQVWHWWADGRTYYGTKTEISEDGVNWTTIFDSAVSGTYKETEQGKVHTQRYAQVVASLNEEIAKNKHVTTIEGGVINSGLVKLYDAGTEENTSGLSGIINGNLLNPSFWSGGTYAQAVALADYLSNPTEAKWQNLAKIIHTFGGTSKMGVLLAESTGRVKIVDPATGSERIIFLNKDIPTVSYLLNETQDGDSVNTGSGAVTMTTPQVTLSGSVTISQDNSTLTFGGALMTITAFRGPGSGSAQANIEVLRNGSLYANIASVSVFVSSGESGYEEINTGVKVLTGVPTGTYTLRLRLTYLDDIIGASGTVGTSTLAWSFSKNVEYFQFGLDGMMSWWQDFHVHMSRNGGFDGRALPSKWNAPGVLLSATVLSGGGWQDVWGAKTSATNPARNSAGKYTVYHNVGHTKYQVTASPLTGNRTYYIVSKSATNFVIQWYTVGSSPAASDTNFDFQITGNNYN